MFGEGVAGRVKETHDDSVGDAELEGEHIPALVRVVSRDGSFDLVDAVIRHPRLAQEKERSVPARRALQNVVNYPVPGSARVLRVQSEGTCNRKQIGRAHV